VRAVCRPCKLLMRNVSISKCPETFLRHLYSHLKRSRQDCGWHLTPEDLLEVWIEQEGKCALSGVFMTWKKGEGGSEYNVSIDRVVTDGPYTRANIQLVCYRINMMKHVLSDNELYWWCKNVVDFKEKV
jgi:hypothetical protein